jgi:COMPASS component SWD2
MNSELPKISENINKQFCIRHEVKSSHPVRFMDFYQAGDRMSYVDGDNLKVLRFTNEEVKTLDRKLDTGIKRVKYLSGKNSLVYSSHKNDEYHLRIVDVGPDNYQENILSLAGHSAEVTSISVVRGNPDVILSTALDKRLYLWDSRELNYTHKLDEFPSPTIACFHPLGNLIAVSYDSHIIELYDKRNLAKNAKIAKIILDRDPDENLNWKEIQYSPDGGSIMVSTDTSCIALIDPDEGKYVHKFRGE